MSYVALIIAAAAVAQPQAKLTYHARLENAARMPVVVSPDGKRVIYFTREMLDDGDDRRPAFAYNWAKLDGTDQQRLFQTPVDWDETLNAVTHDRIISADGQHIAVATTDNGHTLRTRDDPGRLTPAIRDAEGNIRPVDCDLGSTGGFGFAGNDFVFLDTPGFSSGQGYQLKIERDGKQQVVTKDEKLAAHSLRISPAGDRAAFYVSQHVLSRIVHLRMVDLKSGEVTDSPEFYSQEATFDGRPQLFWDADGRGVFCHVSIQQRSRWPFELTRYNFETKDGRVVTPTRNLAASAVLDDDYMALWHPDAGGSSVLRLSDRQVFALPEHNYILGGRGRQVIVADLERDSVYAATVELVGDDEPTDSDDR